MPGPVRVMVPLVALVLACNLCEDQKCGVGLDFVLPGGGAVDVPTNTNLWIGGQGCTDPGAKLIDAEGHEVATTRGCIETDWWSEAVVVLHPNTELQPFSMYTIEYEVFYEPEHHQFRTGAGPTTDPPTPPSLVDVAIDHASTCGGHHAANFSLNSPAPLLLVDANERTTFEATAWSGTVAGIADRSEDLQLGSVVCRGDNLGDTTRRSSATVRFGALDLAGNFSGWSEPEEVSMSGCRMTGSPPLLLPVLLLLVPRRRARG